MRQVRLGGGALHVHFSGERTQRIHGAARIADDFFLLLRRLLDRQGELVGDDHLLAQAPQRADVFVHQPLAVRDRVDQAFALVAHQGPVAGTGLYSALEFSRGLFHAGHFGQGAGAAFDETGVSGAGFSRLQAQAFRGLAGLVELPLRIRQRLVGLGALFVQARDRLAGFGLAGIKARHFLTNPADLGLHQLRALLHAELVLGGALALAFDADDGFFLAMEFRGQADDGRRRERNGLLEVGGLRDQLFERNLRLGELLAQFLDLALRRQNAARLGLVAAGHQIAAAEHVALECDHRERHGRCYARSRFKRFGDHGAAHHRLDGLRERTADAHHRRERDGARRDGHG